MRHFRYEVRALCPIVAGPWDLEAQSWGGPVGGPIRYGGSSDPAATTPLREGIDIPTSLVKNSRETVMRVHAFLSKMGPDRVRGRGLTVY